MSFLGPLIGAGASIIGGIIGSKQASKAGKAGKKAAKQQIALGQDFTSKVDPQYTADMARQKAVLDSQLAAAKAARTGQNRLLSQGQAKAEAQIAQGRSDLGVWNPYMGAGKDALAARAGLYGESPEAAAGFIDRFKTSPLYQLNYDSMIEEGEKGVNRGYAAAGGLNSGAILKALQTNATNVTNRLLPQYVSDIDRGVGYGLQGTQGYSDASGRLLGYGLDSNKFYAGAGVDVLGRERDAITGAQSAYGTNTAQLGQNRLSNLGVGYGAQSQGYANKAAAAAGKAAGITNAWGNAAQGVSQAFGSGFGSQPAGGSSPAYAGYSQPAGYGPTNIVPTRYYS